MPVAAVTSLSAEERDRIYHVGHLDPGRFHNQRSFYGIRAAALVAQAPVEHCDLCAKGFPVEDGWHYPTQELGMIPNTKCRSMATEVDQWLYSPLSWICMGVMLKKEDFALVDDEHKRWFLFLCSEILYGDNADESVLADCMQQANKPL